jgi:[protein-PII] uridylyltransferase
MNGLGLPIYNDFSSRLINTLYTQASLAISNVKRLQETSKRIKKEKQLQRTESFKLLARSLQRKTIKISSDMFFIKNRPQRIVNIVQKAQELKDYDFVISNNKFLTIELLRKGNFDLSYLLQKLLRLDVVSLDIYKLFSNIKYFRIDFNEKLNDENLIDIHDLLIEALTKTHELKIKKPKILEKNIFIDCEHSKEHAMLKIDCPNQKGLLSYVIKLFDNLQIDISSAKIHTKMNRINDLFLIEKNGNFCDNTSLIIKELTEN